jgi:hypothetical protein
VQTEEWGIEVAVVELNDVQLPEGNEARDGARGRGGAREAREDHAAEGERSRPTSWPAHPT